jgi:hypothetical protein
MAAITEGTVGIVPPGALGVSFFYHLTRELRQRDGRVSFLARGGSASAAALSSADALRVRDSQGLHRVPLAGLLHPDLLACHTAGGLPEVLLACPNPDQLLPLITACVELLERAHSAGGLSGGSLPLPQVVLCSNGIYFQRLRQIYLEKLEEATLLGRLPDLWPDLMPRIVGRLLRGVTIQTGVREGTGADAIYQPGPRGITRLAGGDAASRERCQALLSGLGGWFELAAHSSATRLEFDKAMVNLTANLFGQLYAIDDAGRFTPLTVAQITVPERHADIREMAGHVHATGLAVRAYAAGESPEAAFRELIEGFRGHEHHVPSSLQWVGLKLRLGQLAPELTPTETWLLEPLIRYARSAGLEDSARYFEQLKERLLRKLVAAAGRKTGLDPAPHS